MPTPRHTSATTLAAATLLPLLAGCGGSVDDFADSLPSPPVSSSPSPADTAAPGPIAAGQVSMEEAIDALEVAAEVRDGYDRDTFNHWTDADGAGDGCDTRDEVLLQEALTKPEQGENCELTGGEWKSSYDGETVNDASDLDIDHMVPLAEAWDSGASGWNAEKREAYANDLGAQASLVAVTASTNRSKSDQDPAEWMPPAEEVHCTYTADWIATKLRWHLTVDTSERAALEDLADGCPEAPVEYEPTS